MSQNTLESIWINLQQLDFLKSSNQLEALIKMQEIPLN
ncbi:hypothetical protein HPHPH43_0258 [Helicobacter pylori Hp H-43]|nr:hypothetical protein HPHPH43_0258 [Helicobacter pylori Hp H-43]